MAYSDAHNGRTFNAGSMAATLFLNGALIAVVASFTPGVADIFKEPDGTIIWIPTAPPKEPEKPIDTKKEAAKPDDSVRQPSAASGKSTPTTNPLDGVQLASGTEIDFPTLPPIGESKSDPLPTAKDPIRIGARLDGRYAGALQPAYPPGLARNGV